MRLIPLKTHIYGQGFEAMLFNGVLALVGLAMVIPLFVPSRWRRRTVSGVVPVGPSTGLLTEDSEAPTQQGACLLPAAGPVHLPDDHPRPVPAGRHRRRGRAPAATPSPRRRRTRSRSDSDGNGFCPAAGQRKRIAPHGLARMQVTPL